MAHPRAATISDRGRRVAVLGNPANASKPTIVFTPGQATPSSPWATGTWNDSIAWNDDAVWKDVA